MFVRRSNLNPDSVIIRKTKYLNKCWGAGTYFHRLSAPAPWSRFLNSFYRLLVIRGFLPASAPAPIKYDLTTPAPYNFFTGFRSL